MYETSREVIRIWSTRPLPHALSFHRHLEPHTYTPTHILHPYDTAHAALKGDTAETKIHLLDQLKSRLKRKITLKKRLIRKNTLLFIVIYTLSAHAIKKSRRPSSPLHFQFFSPHQRTFLGFPLNFFQKGSSFRDPPLAHPDHLLTGYLMSRESSCLLRAA